MQTPCPVHILAVRYTAPIVGDIGLVSCHYLLPMRESRTFQRRIEVAQVRGGALWYEDIQHMPIAVIEAMAAAIPE